MNQTLITYEQNKHKNSPHFRKEKINLKLKSIIETSKIQITYKNELEYLIISYFYNCYFT
jgi:hypothetical protein